jgi:hypothetical protein
MIITFSDSYLGILSAIKHFHALKDIRHNLTFLRRPHVYNPFHILTLMSVRGPMSTIHSILTLMSVRGPMSTIQSILTLICVRGPMSTIHSIFRHS